MKLFLVTRCLTDETQLFQAESEERVVDHHSGAYPELLAGEDFHEVFRIEQMKPKILKPRKKK